MLLALGVHVADTISKLTPAEAAMLSHTASTASGLEANAGPLPTAMSIVPTIFATEPSAAAAAAAAAGAKPVVVEAGLG